ncbi:MAG: alpha-L-arabinofuranosidase C-terminal domain-containing protein [Roseburia sp.]
MGMETKLLVHYDFADAAQVGRDVSGNGFHAEAEGSIPPQAEVVQGRNAVSFAGGANGTSYLRVPAEVFAGIGDNNGITVAAWVNPGKNGSVWERIVDFGKGEAGPYLFLTRNLRGVCFGGQDLAADPVTVLGQHEWVHVAMTVSGTCGGTMSSAGPMIYINGEVAADGTISQTTSGLYGKLREWFASFEDSSNYVNNFLGRSQFGADADFCGSLSDFRIYQGALSGQDILELMCESFSDGEMVDLACRKYLEAPAALAVRDYELPQEFLRGKVRVSWASSRPEVIGADGRLGDVKKAEKVTLTATLRCEDAKAVKEYQVTALPKETVPYTIRVHADEETMPVSETLWGLFYEDINNAADGGIYAEQIQNRSFENFHFEVYDGRSGAEGKSSGRVREPLAYWFGDVDRCTPHFQGGLNEQLGAVGSDVNNCYISVTDGTVISNRGFCDTNYAHSIVTKAGACYDFSIWVRAKKKGSIGVFLRAADGTAVSETVLVEVEANSRFVKYGAEEKIRIMAKKADHAELVLSFHGDMDIDFVSLMPEDVWGAEPEADSPSAHCNFMGNTNYRLRKDLVQALKDLHPSFLRFPGGCISEGSYIWENVYDWKDSVGPVELRRENFNVWGYVMTMGLGYMEYFQLAEDLGATPLPVMACGVLCQARSDYANPAGGALQEKYIKNFTDLIDFAISTDFEGNEWAALRKRMGHEAPFDLHYLGVGNENWGEEFMANFEIFYSRITGYVEKNYPGYPLTIISTVGAQADDDAYRLGWKFLAGANQGETTVDFTDGEKSWAEKVRWYENKSHYMDTIADEHYYRPNTYLLNNTDRYEYYERAYRADGTIDDAASSKVFVGEYASTDKNTLAGAVAEAAVMTGFENNTDVVRLAATAPLFNKVLTDNQYRWTPDCIWFDNESVWHTPTYYVQQMFAANLGKTVVSTDFITYEDCERITVRPRGGIAVTTGNAAIAVKEICVTDKNGDVLLKEDLTKGIGAEWNVVADGVPLGNGAAFPFERDDSQGLILPASTAGENGIFLIRRDWSEYRVTVKAVRLSGNEGFFVGAGVTDYSAEKKNALQYVIGLNGDTTGIRVYKDGVEGYTLGDFSSSVCAGNLRSAMYEGLEDQTEYTVTFDYGAADAAHFSCGYRSADFRSREIRNRLLPYRKEIFRSATKDKANLYLKLVNAEDTEKRVGVEIAQEQVTSGAKLILLAAEEGLAHVQNVNTKEKEPVAPVTSNVSLENGYTELTLPAQSVAVLVCGLVK